MDVEIKHLIEGAKEAEGLTVIIDVLRAFSVECYAFDRGISEIYPVGDINLAYSLRERNPDLLLIGERDGLKCKGFDFGNSPSEIEKVDLNCKKAAHTTSAGTQGIASAVNATEILTGSLVNAKATAQYIKNQNPDKVTLVAMGFAGTEIAEEDELCAEYIKALLEEREFPNIDKRIEELKRTGGRRFFDISQQEAYPEVDFYKCMEIDKFPFVIRVRQKNGINIAEKYEV